MRKTHHRDAGARLARGGHHQHAVVVGRDRRLALAGLLAGLAGRLKVADIAGLVGCGADYLGFRSALCAAGERRAPLDERAFAAVRAALRGATARTVINTREVY